MRTILWANIVEVLGQEVSDKILLKNGGRALYIPLNPRGSSPVVKIIGLEAAKLLASQMGGESVDVPILRGKHIVIDHLRNLGLSISEIAARMRCTERTVYYNLAKSRAAAASRKTKAKPKSNGA